MHPSRWNQAALDDHVRAAYDRWKARYLVAVGKASNNTPLYRVAFAKPEDDGHSVTVSEGQGFGMVIVAHMAGHDRDARQIFDGLWRFSRSHPSTIDARLMAWKVPGGNDSAFDGDCDMALGLLLADAQWGSEGDVNYLADFTKLSAGIAASTLGPRSKLPLLGDWVRPNGEEYNQDSPRTSDFMLGHFQAFARASGDPLWDDVRSACGGAIDTLQDTYSSQTGLLPDFAEPRSATDRRPQPATPGFLEGKYDGDYFYNAGRVPWRLGVHALVDGDNATAERVLKISRWAAGVTNGNARAFRSGYHLDGTPLANSNYFSTFFVAPLGVAAMLDRDAQAWLDAIYAAIYDVSDNYYEDSVTLLCLLAITGNFWHPGA